MVSIGEERELSAKADEFHEMLKEFNEERVDEIEKEIDGKKCICVRLGGFRGFEKNERTKCTIRYKVVKILE